MGERGHAAGFQCRSGGEPAAARIRSPRRTPRKLHSYFVGFAIVFAVIVLTGFSRTFFLPMARGTLAKPLIVHVHGAFFFAWTGLLVTQALLAHQTAETSSQSGLDRRLAGPAHGAARHYRGNARHGARFQGR